MEPKQATVPLVAGGIPEELRERPQWVNWKLERRGDELTKVPYTPNTNRRASTTDLMTWGTFEEAAVGLATGRYSGVGFVFCSGDPYTGIDLDKVRNPETGELEEWAQEIVDAVAAYAEVSVSGRGVHIIVKGELPNSKRGSVECYSQKRFFCMTGRLL
jgi:putative DNA primase/helicase